MSTDVDEIDTTEPLPPTRSGFPWWTMVLAAVAAAAIAFAVAWFTSPGPTASTPGDDSAEAGFARDMQVHHAQAVDLAMELYSKTEDPELRVLAFDIVTGQQAQIGEMQYWLAEWGLPAHGAPLMEWMMDGGEHAGHGGSTEMTEEEARAAMGMASDEQLREFDAATGTAADCQFLELMTTHHLGAIEMVDAILDRATNPRVLAVAQKMKDAQQFELDSMAASQTRLGCG